ncbi:hypothetical protein GCM10010483_49570 [Actinokineospora diospyrosa]
MLLNMQPMPAAAAAPSESARPVKQSVEDFAVGKKLPAPRTLPGSDRKIAPLTSEMKPTEPKSLAGTSATTGAGISFSGDATRASAANNLYCTPYISHETSVVPVRTGPYSDTSYMAGVQCNFVLDHMYGVSGAIDRSPYYQGEIGYIGREFAHSGDSGSSFGGFRVQGDRFDGGRQVEIVLELVLVASAIWVACDPLPGLRYLLCEGLGTKTMHVVVGTAAFSTGLAPPVIRYAALGDSYSAGNGAPTDLDLTLAPDCRRSTQTYSYRLTSTRLPLGGRGESLPIDVPFLGACSGARIEHFDTAQPEARTAQRKFVSRGNDRLVTLTFGGNDLGFTDRLESCFKGYCADEPLLAQADLTALQGRLTALYRNIRSHMRADGLLAVLSYPAVLPNPNDPQDYQRDFVRCTAVNNFLSDRELRRIYEAATQIKEVIAAAVAATGDPRVRFIDTLDAFRGHRVCAPDDQLWAANISYTTTSDTFHPNPAGYQEMARQVRAQLGLG